MQTTRVLGETECSNCGARAYVRAQATEGGSDAMMTVVSCSKCMHTNVLGFTTSRAIKIMERREKIEQALCSEPDRERRIELYEELQRLILEEHRHELGL